MNFPRKDSGEIDAHLSLALPVDEEGVFVDLEHTVGLEVRVVLFLRPAIEHASLTEGCRYLDLPIELEPFRHLRGADWSVSISTHAPRLSSDSCTGSTKVFFSKEEEKKNRRKKQFLNASVTRLIARRRIRNNDATGIRNRFDRKFSRG